MKRSTSLILALACAAIYVLALPNVSDGQDVMRGGSASMPSYSIGDYCSHLTRDNPSYWLENACIQQEKTAFAGLGKMNFEGRMITYCRHIVESGGNPSYWLLKACIEQEIAAKNAR
jgi:hypothetical protein